MDWADLSMTFWDSNVRISAVVGADIIEDGEGDERVEGGVRNNQDNPTTVPTTQSLRRKYQTTIEGTLDKDNKPSNKQKMLPFNENPDNPILLMTEESFIPTSYPLIPNANQRHPTSNHVATVEEVPDKDEDPTNKPATIPFDGEPDGPVLLANEPFGTMEDDIQQWKEGTEHWNNIPTKDKPTTRT